MEHIFIVSIVIALILTVTGTLIFIIASTFQTDEQEYVLNKQKTDILHEKLSKALDMCGYDLRLNEPYGRFMIDVMIRSLPMAHASQAVLVPRRASCDSASAMSLAATPEPRAPGST